MLGAAAELGYVPSVGPRTESMHITFIFDSLQSDYSLRILSGATEAAQEAGIILQVMSEDFPAGPAQKDGGVQWLTELVRRGTNGLVLVTSTLTQRQADHAAKLDLPIVMVDPAEEVPASVASLGSTNWVGGYQATSHLLERGHTRIGFLAGTRASVPSNERLQGYRSALAEAGIDFDDSLVAGYGFLFDDGSRGAHELLSREERPTAIVAVCDVTAVAAMNVARKLGLHVPGDVSIVGFDDTNLASLVTPSLTSVRQPLVEMGRSAVSVVLGSEGRREFVPVQLRTKLIERESVADCHR